MYFPHLWQAAVYSRYEEGCAELQRAHVDDHQISRSRLQRKLKCKELITFFMRLRDFISS